MNQNPNPNPNPNPIQNPLSQALAKLKTTIYSIGNKFADLKTTYEVNHQLVMKEISEIDALITPILSNENINKSLKDDLAKTQQELASTRQQLQAKMSELEDCNKQKELCAKRLVETAQNNVELKKQLDELNRQQQGIAANIEQLNSELNAKLTEGVKLINDSFTNKNQESITKLGELKTKLNQARQLLVSDQNISRGGKKHRKQSRKKVKHGKKRRTQKRNKIQKGGYKYNNNKQLDESSSIISSPSSSKSKSYSNKSKSRNMRRSRK